jgi:arylsulfatase A-like enzyme
MPADELIFAKILRKNGYATGHTGKWHMAKDHYAFPGPLDQGFDFTSDNGGMETSIKEVITSNTPIDRGKLSPKEGGVRVPFLVAGSGIPAGRESDVMVNGIDFYPTILSMSGIAKPDAKNLDGADLLPLLTGVADDPTLVLDQHGKPRTEMVWHYPHVANPKLQSTLLSASALGSKNPSHQSPQPLAKHH